MELPPIVLTLNLFLILWPRLELLRSDLLVFGVNCLNQLNLLMSQLLLSGMQVVCCGLNLEITQQLQSLVTLIGNKIDPAPVE